MENLNQEQSELIAKHLKGETSSFENKLLEEWIQESAENKTIYEELRYIWSLKKASVTHVPDVNSAWDKVRLKAGIEQPASEGKVRSLFESRAYLKIAASIVLVIGIGYLLRMSMIGREETIQVLATNGKKEILLPDSSKVWLNKNASLTYTTDYNKSIREVQLQGEAFFEVVRNTEKPFIVNGIFSRTQVLGTSFKVKTSTSGNADEVEVSTGKVSVRSNHKDKGILELLPGDKGVVRENGDVQKLKIEDVNSLSWKNEELNFENTPLKDVAVSIENYFHVKVEVESTELNNCEFTGTFSQPQLEELMKVLSVSMNLSYDKKGNKYFLTGKGCNQ